MVVVCITKEDRNVMFVALMLIFMLAKPGYSAQGRGSYYYESERFQVATD